MALSQCTGRKQGLAVIRVIEQWREQNWMTEAQSAPSRKSWAHGSL